MTMMLEVDDLAVSYGTLDAVTGLNIRVPRGATVALVGANGVGKTTTLKAISGEVPARSGSIRLDGVDITRRQPWTIARAGITHIPERRGVFAAMTVNDNLSVFADATGASADAVARVYETFPRLAERRHQLAGTLSGGEQQMLAVARVELAQPKLLMVDEPSTGLAPVIVEQLYRQFREMNNRGMSMLIVEQYLTHVLNLADVCFVMEKGTISFVGEPAELRGRGLLES